MVRHRTVSEFPITIQDVSNTLEIFGPDLSGVRGKIVRCNP